MKVEKQTRLLGCYIFRVENGHTIPTDETFEKLAQALEISMYEIVYDGEQPPKVPNLLKRKNPDNVVWGSKGKESHLLANFRRAFSRVEESDMGLVLYMATKMARRKAV